MNPIKLLTLLVLAVVTASTVMSIRMPGPAAAQPAKQATPAATGTPYALSGRLGAYVQVADGCSHYPLTDCTGQEIQVSEQTMDQLRPFVGTDVKLTVVTAECGRGIAGQPLYGPVAISVQAGVPCATPTVPVLSTPTPSTMPTAPVQTTPTPPVLPTAQAVPTGTPYALSGRLGAYVQVADACSYYTLIDCAGREIQVSEKTRDLLRRFVGNNVRVTVVTAECGTSIAGRPLYGPVAISVQAGVPCPIATPSGPPTPSAAQVCPFIQNRVPAVAINAALANPESIRGWGERCNTSLPANPSNGVRGWLSVQSISVPYHPTYNPLEFKCGCP